MLSPLALGALLVACALQWAGVQAASYSFLAGAQIVTTPPSAITGMTNIVTEDGTNYFVATATANATILYGFTLSGSTWTLASSVTLTSFSVADTPFNATIVSRRGIAVRGSGVYIAAIGKFDTNVATVVFRYSAPNAVIVDAPTPIVNLSANDANSMWFAADGDFIAFGVDNTVQVLNGTSGALLGQGGYSSPTTFPGGIIRNVAGTLGGLLFYLVSAPSSAMRVGSYLQNAGFLKSSVDTGTAFSITDSLYMSRTNNSLFIADGSSKQLREFSLDATQPSFLLRLNTTLASNVTSPMLLTVGQDMLFYDGSISQLRSSVYDQSTQRYDFRSDTIASTTGAFGTTAASDSVTIIGTKAEDGSTFTLNAFTRDGVTQPVTVTAPAASSAVGSSFAVTFSVGENAPNGVTMTISCLGTSVAYNISAVTQGSYSFNYTWNAASGTSGPITYTRIGSTALNASASNVTITMKYQDGALNYPATGATSSFSVKTVALVGSMTYPTNNLVVKLPTFVAVTVPETQASTWPRVNFHSNSFDCSVTVPSCTPAAICNLTITTASLSCVSGTQSIPDGTYNVSLETRDIATNPSSYTSGVAIRLDTQILTGVNLSLPSAASNLLTLTYYLPEAASSVLLYVGTATLSCSGLSASFTTVSLNLSNLTVSDCSFVGGDSTHVDDGNVNISLEYYDVAGNGPASTPTYVVAVTRTTNPINLTNVRGESGQNFSYADASNSAKLYFTVTWGSKTNAIFLYINGTPGFVQGAIANIEQDTTGQVNTSVDLRMQLDKAHGFLSTFNLSTNIAGCSGLSCNLPDGTYQARLTYQDSLQNPFVTSPASAFLLDTVTNPCSLAATASSVSTASTLTLSLGESPAATAFIIWTKSSGGVVNTTLTIGSGVTLLNVTVTLAGATGCSGSGVAACSGNITEGLWNASLYYGDSHGNQYVSCSLGSFITVDTTTQLPTGFSVSPVVSSSLTNLTISYTLPEAGAAGFIVFKGADLVNLSLAASALTAGAHSITVPRTNLSATTEWTATTTALSVIGNYNATITYIDAFRNPSASASANFVVDYQTAIPTFLLPASSSVIIAGGAFVVNYTLPEAAKNDTVQLVFRGLLNTLTATMNESTVMGTQIPVVNGVSFSPNMVKSITPAVPFNNKFPDDTYTVLLSYQDSFGNPATNSTSHTNIIVDTVTQAPVVFAPVAGVRYRVVPIQYELPESAASGSITVKFTNKNDANDVYFTLSMVDAEALDFVVDFSQTEFNLTGISNNVTVERPNRTADEYLLTCCSLTVSYQDAYGNAVATSAPVSFIVDITSTVPLLVSPARGTSANVVLFTYLLPATPNASTVKITVFNSLNATVSQLVTASTATKGNFTWNPQSNTVSDAAFTPSLPVAAGVYTFRLEYVNPLDPQTVNYVDNPGITLDYTTITPTVYLPSSNTRTTASFSVVYNLPETPLSGSAVIRISGSSGNVDSQGASAAGNFSLAAPALADGSYNVTVTYQDKLGNPSATSAPHTFIVDTVTVAPMLTAPASSTRYKSPIVVTATFPEQPLDGSATITWTRSGNPATSTWSLAPRAAGVFNVSWDPRTNASLLAGVQSVQSSFTLPDGSYSVTVRYQDQLGNPAQTSTATSVVIDTATAVPTQISAPNATSYRLIPVTVTLPELMSYARLTLTRQSDGQTTFVFLNVSSLSISAVINPSALASSTGIVNTSRAAIADGAYNLTLSVSDLVENAEVTVALNSIVVDTVTLAPSLTSPVSSIAPVHTIQITYTLPEAPLAGSVILSVVGKYVSVELTLTNALSDSFTWDPSVPPITLTGHVVATSNNGTLFDDNYTFSLRYQDAAGNPSASVTVPGVVVDTHTLAPSLSSPLANSLYSTDGIIVTFSLPEAFLPGSVKITIADVSASATMVITVADAAINGTVTFVLSTTALIVADGHLLSNVTDAFKLHTGAFTFTLAYQDATGNTAAFSPTRSLYVDLTSASVVRMIFSVRNFNSTNANSSVAAVITTVAVSLGVDPLRLRAPVGESLDKAATTGADGITTLTIDILDSGSTADLTPLAVFDLFQQEMADPNSQLRRNLPNLDTTTAASASLVCYNSAQVVIGCPVSGSTGGDDTNLRIAIGVIVGCLALILLLVFWIIHKTSDRNLRAKEEAELAQFSAATFKDVDQNNDGNISQEEFNRYVSLRVKSAPAGGSSSANITEVQQSGATIATMSTVSTKPSEAPPALPAAAAAASPVSASSGIKEGEAHGHGEV